MSSHYIVCIHIATYIIAHDCPYGEYKYKLLVEAKIYSMYTVTHEVTSCWPLFQINCQGVHSPDYVGHDHP